MTPSRAHQALAIATAVVVLGTSVASLWAFGNGGHDDSHITYGAARSMWEHGLPRNPNGELVEQSSTPGFTVVLAILAALPVPLPWLGVVASLIGRGLTIGALVTIGERSRAGAGWIVLAIAATEPLQSYWGTSGMETTAAALGVVVLPPTLDALLREDRRWPWALGSGWMVAVRPEGAAVVGCLLAVAGVWAMGRRIRGHRFQWEALAVGLAAPGAVLGGLTLVRWTAYGVLLPQPVISKMLTERGFEYGKRYLEDQGDLVSWIAVVAAGVLLVGLGRAWRRREPVLHELLAGGAVLATGSFAVLAGGDWMEGGRFLVAVAAASVGGIAVGARHVPLPALTAIAVALIARHAVLTTDLATTRGTGSPLGNAPGTRAALPEAARGYPLLEYANMAHVRDVHLLHAIEAVLPEVRARSGARPIVVMSGQAGMVPYYLFDRHEGLWFVDANSLVTSTVNPCIPAEDFNRWPSGWNFSLRTVVRHADAIRSRCGVELPAIVYESGRNARRFLQGLPYTLVHEVHGVPRGRARPGRPPMAGGWVAVRNDLLPAAPP